MFERFLENRLSIYVTVGSTDALYTNSGCSPTGGRCEPDMDTQLANLGIAHDPLQVLSGVGHDLTALLNGINNANWTFAATYFP